MKANLEELLDLPKEVTEKAVEQAKNLSLAELVSIFNAIVSTQDMAKKIDSYRIPLEVMVIKLTQKETPAETAPKGSFVGSAAKVVVNKMKLNNSGALFVEPKNKDTPVPPQPKDVAPAEPQAQGNPKVLPPLDFNTVLNAWPQLVDTISQKKMSVGTYLKDARPVKLEEDVLTIGFSKRALFYKEAVEQRHNQKLITDRANELFNSMISLKFELLEDLDKAKANDSDDKVEDNNSEFIKSVLDTFNGRLFKK
jgi:hypothetical protein